jgi:hypothetical protein
MTTTDNIVKAPYLRNQRQFPFENMKDLAAQAEQAYRDTALKVNARTIGLYPTNFSVPTGERWYLSNGTQRQQTLRQVYNFTSSGSFNHNINVASSAGFTMIYGTFTDGTNWYPLPYVDVVSATNQVNIKVTPTQVTITAGGGSPPTISSGFVVLEWLAVV